MSLKPKLEALIYAAEEPVSLDQLVALLKDDLLAMKASAESEQQNAEPPAAPAPTGRGAKEKSEKAELRALLRPILEELASDYASENHGIEVRQVAGGYRMSTKPEHHDVVRAFAKSQKPPVRLSLQALETLAVVAYKQPVTVPEIGEIRGVDASGVIGTLIDRKLITTAGRKAVVGRPMLYKTTKDFLLRFGLKDLNELPSVEEFEKLAAGEQQGDLFVSPDTAIADATGVPEVADDAAAEPASGNEGQSEHESAISSQSHNESE